MVTIAIVIVAVLLVAVVALIVAASRSDYAIKAVVWHDGDRWIRLSPNPGVRLGKGFQWSKAYGRGRR